MKTFTAFVIAATLAAAPLPAKAQDVMGTTGITGAGSTFAAPVISRWEKGYKKWSAGSEYATTGGGLDDPPAISTLDYEPVGSLAGTMRVRQGAVDFGASDVPLSSEDLAKLGLGQFPIVIGGVVAVVNIDGVAPGAIKFTGPLLSDIFLGKVQKWSDPAIKALNPDLKLPDANIAVVRRSDGSGTTYNFTNYLSKVSPEWKSKVGSDLLVNWPVGAGAKGNEGVAQAVSQTKNAIGYVEYVLATQMKLAHAQIQNRAGKFITASPRSFQAAAAGADWAKAGEFNLMLTDPPGDDAYPMAATVFIQMHKKPRFTVKTQEAFHFFRWALQSGARDAAQLGYVPLPPSLVKLVEEYWARNFKAGV